MAVFVQGSDIGSSWLAAYKQLQSSGHAVNLAVAIENPLQEDLGVRRAIEAELVAQHALGNPSFKSPQSMHTVANTIFPISLYRPGKLGAADRFFANALRVEQQRATAKHRQWGTYVGRLVAYPSADGTRTNQLGAALKNLQREREYKDRYELPLVTPEDQSASVEGSVLLHSDSGVEPFRAQGGPCLAHVSFTSMNGRLSMTALYRAHAYEVRAYGNFVGLARLLSFLAGESGREVGELLVIASHAWADAPSRGDLLTTASAASGVVNDVETHARGLGVGMGDLDLPAPQTS